MTMPAERKYRFREDDGKGTVLVIGVLIVLIVLVGAVLFYVLTQRGEGPPITPPGNATNQSQTNMTNQTNVTAPCDDACFRQRALDEQDFRYCRNISSSTLGQQCYEALASVSLDACKAVADAAKKKACITSFAVSGDNIMLCDFLTTGKEDCQLAVDPCLDAQNRPICRALLTGNAAECQGDSTCLLNYSVTAKNASSCELISDEVFYKSCVSAVRRSDRCSDLTFQAQKDYCYQLFALYSNDYLVCTQITPATTYALDCFSTFAARLHNVSICNDDGFSLNALWECYTNYSLLTGDLAGCERIDKLATTSKFNCAYQYAKEYGNPVACQVITESLTQRSTCYEGAIIYYQENLNWTYCSGILDFNWRNKCYTESAKLYDDITLCDYASAEFARESCRSSYEANKTA